MDQKTASKLIEAATKVRKHAYAPYSNFAVGAALICESGHIFTGCNVENVALGLSICAERCAIAKAFSEGCRDLKAIVIVADSKEPSSPCGICRQVIYEFNPDMIIILANLDGKIITRSAKDLLPHAFSRERSTDASPKSQLSKN